MDLHNTRDNLSALFPSKLLMRGLYVLHVVVVYSFSLLYGIPLYNACLFTHFPINEQWNYLQFGNMKNNVRNILQNVFGTCEHAFLLGQERDCQSPNTYV